MTEPAVGVIRGRDAITQQFLRILRGAEREVLILDRPPYGAEPAFEQRLLERELLRAGVRARTVYDRSALLVASRQLGIRDLAAAGEVGRVLNGVPTKLVIADRKLALIPSDPPMERATVVYLPCPLLDGLVTLFEQLWTQAVPLDLSDLHATVPAEVPTERPAGIAAVVPVERRPVESPPIESTPIESTPGAVAPVEVAERRKRRLLGRRASQRDDSRALPARAGVADREPAGAGVAEHV